MNYYMNSQNQYKNREWRRKNGIKPEKKVYRTKEEFEQLERFLKKEWYDLTHESYSEALKRERYLRLKSLIEEYERQKKMYQAQSEKKTAESLPKTNYKTQKAITAYQEQIDYSKSHNNFKTLSKPATKPEQAIKPVTKVTKPAPIAKTAPKKVTNHQAQKAPKKGFFRRLLKKLFLSESQI